VQFTNIVIMRPFHLAFPVIDLKSTKKIIWQNDGHLNLYGNKLYAEHLIEILKKN